MAKINSHTTLGSSELRILFEGILADLTAITDLVNELKTDHATFKTVVTDLKTSLNSTLTKLDADSGVTDTNYSSGLAVSSSAPASVSASAVTLVTE